FNRKYNIKEYITHKKIVFIEINTFKNIQFIVKCKTTYKDYLIRDILNINKTIFF
ncbi:hypothetical protein BDZ45DRAFT_604710, partial [Acephala macrosclerotiorum]